MDPALLFGPGADAVGPADAERLFPSDGFGALTPPTLPESPWTRPAAIDADGSRHHAERLERSLRNLRPFLRGTNGVDVIKRAARFTGREVRELSVANASIADALASAALRSEWSGAPPGAGDDAADGDMAGDSSDADRICLLEPSVESDGPPAAAGPAAGRGVLPLERAAHRPRPAALWCDCSGCAVC